MWPINTINQMNSYPKFKYGDRAVYKNSVNSFPGKIISASKHPRGAGYIYKIEFDDKDLYPPAMDVEEKYLVSEQEDLLDAFERMLDDGTNDPDPDPRYFCPRCGKNGM